MKKKIAVFEGDGIGPEVTQASIKVLDAIAKKFNHEFEYNHGWIGAAAINKFGNPLPKESLKMASDADAILLGAVGDPQFSDPNIKIRPEQGLLEIRKKLNLFANIRPIKSYEATAHLCPIKLQNGPVDFVIVRELTSGIYFGKSSLNSAGDEARDECFYSIAEIERIVKIGLKLSADRNNKLTLIDKANVLETSRLWRKVVNSYEKVNKDMTFDYLYIDNATMQVILNPYQFDVVVCSNMFGDIISDESSVLAGSLGMLPSGSYSESNALFEPVHGSYPQAKGKDIANPIGSILSAAMMLEYFGLLEEARLIESSIDSMLNNGLATEDLKLEHKIGTVQFTDILINLIAKVNPANGSQKQNELVG